MGIIKKSIVIILITSVILIGIPISVIIISGIPTSGKKIEQYNNPKKALLVIDLQEDFSGKTTNPSSPYKVSGKLISSVNSIIEKAFKQNFKIIYIKQVYDGVSGKMISKVFLGGKAMKGSPGIEVDKRVNVISNNIFSKPKGDAFSNPKLGKFLVEHQVDELYLTGLEAEYCIHSTAGGALNRGYKVNIITDGIFLSAIEKWDDLMKKYKDEGVNLLTGKDL